MARQKSDEEDDGPWLSPRWAMILAAVFVLVVREVIPFGRLALYPLTLFATWVHEMGHGLTALVLGGSFDRLEIYASAGGLAFTTSGDGWPRALVSMGGLLGPPLLGAMILATSRGPRRASIVLWAVAGAMILSTVIWVRSLTGLVVVPSVAVAIALLAYKGWDAVRHLVAQFLGVVLGLDTVSRIDYLFTEHAVIGGQARPSDVANIASEVGGHYPLWGALLAAISLSLLAVGIRIAWMETIRWSDLERPRQPVKAPRAR
ncbi:MAG: M50 family metallopeptidase [Sandaracinaceae bacterium]